MARLGACWADHIWDTTSWESGTWTAYVKEIGEQWQNSVWAAAVWESTVWYPPSSDEGATLPRAKFYMRLVDLSTAFVGEEPTDEEITLPVITLKMDVGELLDLNKILPSIPNYFTPTPLVLDYTGLVDAQELDVIGWTLNVKELVVGVVLPPIVLNFTPKTWDKWGFTLNAIKMLFNVPRDNLITKPIEGFRPSEDLLVKKQKSLVKKKWWKEIVDDIDVEEYDEQG